MTCGKVAHAAQSQSRAWQGTGQSNSPADNSYVLGELGQSIIRLVCSGQLAEADKVLDAAAAKERIPKALYHSLASACQKKLNQPWVALWFLARMERAGYKANIVTFNCTIGAFMRAGDLPEATKWWNSMIDAGLKPNRITYNIMISGCGKICDAASAESWMLRMIADGIQPCTVSYSAVIDAFSRLGDVDSAEKWFFEVIAARVTANFAVYHSMISACAKAGNIEKAERWLAGMLRAGIMPDDRIFNSVINACAPTGDLERAEHWYGQMLTAGFSADAVTFNSILNTCCKAGRADRAMFFFQEMVAHGFPASISCYNCLIQACAQQGDAKSALHWFRKLTAQGLVPNLLTYSGMIETFTECGRTDIAAQWLDRMVAQGIQPDSLTSYLMKPEIVNNMRASRVHFNLPEGADKDEQKWNISTQDSLHSLPPGLEEEIQHSQRTAQIASRSLSDTDSSTRLSPNPLHARWAHKEAQYFLMASKLEYLKKYLTSAPSGGPTSTSTGATSLGSDVRKKKKKHGEEAARGRPGHDNLRMRDISEDLPAFRDDSARKRKIPSFLAKEMDGARPDDELVFVDRDDAENAQKIDVETSGIRWHIAQKAKASKKAPVKREVKREDGSDGDLSPPRGAPPRKVKQEEASDNDGDLSPPRAAPRVKMEKADSDEDLSPPRAGAPGKKPAAGRGSEDADLSPPRAPPKAEKPKEKVGRARHDSDSDLSPPRAAAEKPKEKGGRARHDSDSDLSPPRAAAAAEKPKEKVGRARHDSDSDLSPPRAAAAAEKPKEKFGRARHDSDSDLSPPRAAGGAARKRHDSDSDVSPPRRAAPDEDEPEKMSSGLRSGLVRGSDLKEEAAQVRADRRAAVEMAPDDETGKGATTVYRNREGSKIDRAAWVDQQQKKKKKKMSDYPEQELEWGGGVKQKASQEADKEELERIAAQPFARFQPDEKYVQELKEKQDWADPMRKFQEDEEKVADGIDAMKASNNFGDAQAVVKKKPKCPHAPWLNRHNILPGYRWDGKIRGNGYERRWLEAQNARKNRVNEKWKYEMEEQ